MVARILKAGKQKTLLVSCAIIVLIAASDWYIGNRASLGVLYIVQMMLLGAFLTPVEALSAWSSPSSGLLAIALLRNRRRIAPVPCGSCLVEAQIVTETK